MGSNNCYLSTIVIVDDNTIFKHFEQQCASYMLTLVVKEHLVLVSLCLGLA